ncbi:MAG: hypothetical protein K6G75_10990 [Lachnospiraceae bacterium]|nr:hypothetical protein [Lachnospiraceae bacterium]
MTQYNNIGIDSNLDKKRIAHLFKLGIFAALMVLAGDMLLGWGVSDNSMSGIDQYFSRYLTVSNGRIIASAILGLIGIPIESLSYFGVYRLIASKSEKLAHIYRAGLLGMLGFGAFTHVMCCAVIYYLNAVYELNPALATESAVKFALFFLLPVMLIFLPFFLTAAVTQFVAFAKGMTPYPKWCCIFTFLAGFVVAIIIKFIGNHSIVNAITTGWISIGALWAFGGLLITMKKADM